MPFEIEKHPGGIAVRYFGFVSPGEFLESQSALANDPEGPERRFALCDFSGMDTDSIWALTPEVTDIVGKRNIEHKRDRSAMRKLALVTTSQKIREQCEIFVEHYLVSSAAVRFFSSAAQAWTWIGSEKHGSDGP